MRLAGGDSGGMRPGLYFRAAKSQDRTMERNTDTESHRPSKLESERRNGQRRRESRREHKRIRIVEDPSDRRQEERRE